MPVSDKVPLIRQLTFLYVAIPISKVIFGLSFVLPSVSRLVRLVMGNSTGGAHDFQQLLTDILIGVHFTISLIFLTTSVCISVFLTKNIEALRVTGFLKIFLIVGLASGTVSSFLHAVPMIINEQMSVRIEHVFTIIVWETVTMLTLIFLALCLGSQVARKEENDRKVQKVLDNV